MTKGTPSFGKRSRVKSHKLCSRCGARAFHKGKRRCASCGWGAMAGMRRYNWSVKSIRRRTTGTGRVTHLREVAGRLAILKRFKANYRKAISDTRKRHVDNYLAGSRLEAVVSKSSSSSSRSKAESKAEI